MADRYVFNPFSGTFDVVSDVNISDEGISQGAAKTINFVGAGVTATVASSTATVTIAGGGASSEPTISDWFFQMALLPGGDDGTLNGTTEVTLVAAPGASVQRIIQSHAISIENRDTAVVTVEVRKVSSGGTRRIWRGDLDVGDTWYNDNQIVLDATTDSVRAVMSAAAATTNPDWNSAWGDAS